MNIISVTPSEHNGPNSTYILAIGEGQELATTYVYSHTYELIHDPKNPTQWMGWNGGTLTEAILFVINLK